MKQPQETKPGTIYVCGPITNIPENNFPAFKKVQEVLDSEAISNIIPHEIFDGIDTKDFTHNDFMKYCVSHLAFCDKVITLKGWESSVDATMEVRIARAMGKEVINADVFLKQLTESKKATVSNVN